MGSSLTQNELGYICAFVCEVAVLAKRARLQIPAHPYTTWQVSKGNKCNFS